jgi:hypothetical protein
MKLSNEGERLAIRLLASLDRFSGNSKFKHAWELCQVS